MTSRMSSLLVFSVILSAAFSARAQTTSKEFVTEVDINSPIENVFEFATTAQNWPNWHPNTLRTEGADDHSAGVGEQITEYLRVGPIPIGNVHWTVTEYVPHSRWVIAGELANVFKFNIAYTLTPTETGTHFRRVMAVEMLNPVGKVLVNTLGGAYIKVSSEIATQNFKAAIEGTRPVKKLAPLVARWSR